MTPGALLAATVITLWHAMQGGEREALEETLRRANAEAAGRYEVRALAVPFDAFARKLETTIPGGEGPDLFVAAHDRLGDWVEMRLVAPLEPPPETPDVLREGVAIAGTAYGLPVGFKALLLYYNRALLPQGPPPRVETIEALALRLRPRGVYALAYDTRSLFFHAPFLFAAGGRIFDGDRFALFDSTESFARVAALVRAGAVPAESSSALAAQLFNSGRAAIVLSGPWFAGDVTLPPEAWGVAPIFEGHGSFVTVEALFVSRTSKEPEAAREAARAIARAWRPPPGLRALRAAQAEAMRNGVVTPSRPEMSLVWEPAEGLLRAVLDRGVPVEQALAKARHDLAVLARPDPPRADPQPYIAAASALLLVLAGALAARAVRGGALRRAARPEARFAYAISTPALLAVAALVLLPAAYAAGLSLFSHRAGEFTFVGFRNFAKVLGTADVAPAEPGSFYFALAVTVLWTVANVALHVAIGVGLALLLRRPWLALRSVYRVVLILPWAIPSYITALAWRGMFDRQLGAINALLEALGAEPVSWFAQFSTAFAANLATNTWLGFPFMMVVTLGAVQAIPPELEEAARLEGASRAQSLRMVVLPAIRPALGPAVILGSVWTFNMFNVIYLVSGGEPGGATEILISEAYKWAFTRQHRYGYAAAYAVLIFGILLAYSRLLVRARPEEAVR